MSCQKITIFQLYLGYNAVSAYGKTDWKMVFFINYLNLGEFEVQSLNSSYLFLEGNSDYSFFACYWWDYSERVVLMGW